MIFCIPKIFNNFLSEMKMTKLDLIVLMAVPMAKANDMTYKKISGTLKGQRFVPGVLELWLYVIIVIMYLCTVCTLFLLKYRY